MFTKENFILLLTKILQLIIYNILKYYFNLRLNKRVPFNLSEQLSFVVILIK